MTADRPEDLLYPVGTKVRVNIGGAMGIRELHYRGFVWQRGRHKVSLKSSGASWLVTEEQILGPVGPWRKK